MKKEYLYEIIVTDKADQAGITTTRSMMLGLSYSEKLWSNPQVNDSSETGTIEDHDLGITLTVEKADSHEDTATFLIWAQSTDLKKADTFRRELLKHIKEKLGFTDIKILIDEVSSKISKEIYLRIADIEDFLRRYLNRYYIQKEGISWWDSIASKEIAEQVNQRKDDKNIFAGLAATDIRLTNAEELKELAKAAFPDEKFQAQLKQLSDLGNQVSYNNPFTLSDLESAKNLCQELMDRINDGEDKIEDFKVAAESSESDNPASSENTETEEAEEEKEEAVVDKPVYSNVDLEQGKTDSQESEEQASNGEPTEETASAAGPANEEQQQAVAEKAEKEEAETDTATLEREEPEQKAAGPARSFEMISEDDLLSELKAKESSTSGFIDLKTFVTDELSPKGYAPGPIFSLARVMESKGMVKIYDTKDEKGFPIKAISTN